ncbi:hypothetical protein CU098_006465 [Rhizopus stolonifer]|uniref:Uncharacterized protein n=2 Tax=Mucorineae TaxID=1344963 RepID=A0A367KQL7_RHIST|nr:hypothetical protein CU098_006465 [Rhizopus stolonifer]
MSRLPHQIMSKKDDVTKDAEFIQLETRFNETSKMADQLRIEAQTFRDSVSALLTHQAEMANYLSVIYSQQIGVETDQDEVQKRVQSTPSAALQAVGDAEAAMAYCRDEILPNLDSVDQFVIRPTYELQEVIKKIQKTIVKRNHKLIDYDRHRVALSKLTVKTERSLNDEKSIIKIQSQLDVATQDYDYLNNTLKQQLPGFFEMQFHMMQAIFEHLYNLQNKIFGMIYARCYELVTANEQQFVTQSMDIQGGYQWRKQHFDAQAEIENTDLLRSGGKAWLSASGASNNSKLTIQERAALRSEESSQKPHHAEQDQSSYYQPQRQESYQQQDYYPDTQPPSYTSQPSSSVTAGLVSPRAPPPVPPSRNSSTKTYVVALYDYEAQAEGDLSFKKDDKIEVVEKTRDANDWWTGRLRGVVGVFPGNYVTEL